ncbi:MAG: hypothetical protein ACOYEV_05245 [Candidatus Nanopelagicales bacterium]
MTASTTAPYGGGMRLLGIGVMTLLVAGLFDRLMVAAERRGWIYWRKRGTSGAATAAAFSELQMLTSPSYAHVIEQRRHEQLRVDQPDDGAPPAPGSGD